MSQDNNDLSLGELHRTCNRIKAELEEMRKEMKEDRHDLRDRLDMHGVQLALHEQQLQGVKTWKAWGGGVAGGAVLWALDWFRRS